MLIESGIKQFVYKFLGINRAVNIFLINLLNIDHVCLYHIKIK